MIVEQTLLHSPKQTSVIGAWQARIGRPHVTGIRAVARQFARSLTAWARVPVLRYAALWEASVVVSLLNQRESFESERPDADTFVLNDAWLRG
jgi:hypothetical protein